jgi:hypothetical protein
LRTNTVCGIAELTLDFFEQNFPLPSRAVTPDNFTGATIGIAFGGVIAHSDSHIFVEGANRCGTGSFQRTSDNRSEIIGAAVDGHQSLPQSVNGMAA